MSAPVLISAQRQLAIPRADAIGWDIERGYATDPAELNGRAALAARFIARALELGAAPEVAATRGWLRRHRLGPDESCFSYWAPGAEPGTLLGAVDILADRIAPTRAGLAPLVASQLVQARNQRAHPHTALLRAVEEAAWGRSARGAFGDEETLAAVLDSDFTGYVRQCLTDGRLVSDTPAPVVGRDWQGDLVCHERPGQQCRIAVQVMLSGIDAAGAAVLTGLLDGMDGLVHQRLRAETGVVYGTAVIGHRDGGVYSIVMAASMLRGVLPDAVEAFRRLINEVDTGPLEGDRVAVSAERAQHRLLGRLDDPFGALEDRREQRRGAQPGEDVHAAIPEAAARLEAIPRLSQSHRVAIGYLGDPADEADRRLLEKLS